MTQAEFMEWLSQTKEQSEPFCPFPFGGYCNVAYSQSCFTCEEFKEDKAYDCIRKNRQSS